MQTLLTSISHVVGRWDELTHHPAYRIIGVVVGLAAAATVLLMPSPEGLTPVAQRTAAVTLLMALWWVGRVLPMSITALVPLVAFPALGVLSVTDSALPFANPLNMLMLGGFVMGHAMEEAGLHKRLVASVLKPSWVRARPDRVVLAMMVATALLSGLVSNTATVLMLLPVAVSLASRCTDDRRLRSGFVLALAYAGSIGGVATLIGTPPNAILADEAPQITFANWSMIGVPFVLLAIPAAWLVITRVAFALPRTFARPPEPPKTSAWSVAEVGVVVVIVMAMIGWFTRKPIVISTDIALFGWGQLMPAGWSHDAWVAIAAALALFLLPALPKSRRPDHMGRVLLTAKRLDKSVPWSVLILLGGGFSLAEGIKQSQLTQWLAKGTSALGDLQHAFGDTTVGDWVGTGAVILVVCLIMTFLTELTSNTATTRIVLPVLAAGAAAAGVDPVLWMVPATISASCAFMMPVATAPNAIASQAGDVAPGDMAWAGLVLNLVCVVIAAAVSVVMVPLVLSSWP